MVEGNYIGTDVTGTAALRQRRPACSIDSGAANNTVGGTAAGAGNVISGNDSHGVIITGRGDDRQPGRGQLHRHQRHRHRRRCGNDDDGVLILDGAAANTVGGTTAGARNVITGNRSDGVDIIGTGATGNVVEGNYIGTDATGTVALGNGSYGV